jgi:hypothetical protein
LPTSYIELSGTLLPRGHCHTYPPNCCLRLRYRWLIYMVTNGKVRVIRFFSNALTGAELNWSTREEECYGIYFGCKTFEDLLDNRHFILKTDHMNLTYLSLKMTGKVQRWKLYLLDKDFYLCHVPGKEVHQFVPDALSRFCENHILSNESEKPAHKRLQAF